MDISVFFVVETGAYEDGNAQRLLEVFRECGLKSRAFESADGAEARLAPVDVPVVAYGSLGMMAQKRWMPVAWLDPIALSCQVYYPKLGGRLLQENYAFVD